VALRLIMLYSCLEDFYLQIWAGNLSGQRATQHAIPGTSERDCSDGLVGEERSREEDRE